MVNKIDVIICDAKYEELNDLSNDLYSIDGIPWTTSERLLKINFEKCIGLKPNILGNIVMNLASYGVSYEYISQFTSENEMYYESWKKGRDLFRTTYNKELRFGMDELLTDDQYMREDMIVSERRMVDSLNLLKFIELVQVYGFPSTSQTGLDEIRSSDGKISVSEPPYEIIFLHFSLNKSNEFLALIQRALLSNAISSFNYSRLEAEYHLADNYAIKPVFKRKNELYIEKFSSDYIEKIDSLRSTRGLMTYQHHIDQILYNRRNRSNLFRRQIYNLLLPENLIDRYVTKIKYDE